MADHPPLTDPGSRSNLGYSILGNVAAPLAALLTAPLLAQGLGVTARGELSAATAPLLLATAVGGFGIPDAIVHFVARSPESSRFILRSTVWLVVGVGLITSAVIHALADPLAAGNGVLADLIRLAAAGTAPSLLVLVLRSIAAGAHQWRTLALERAAFAVIRLGWVLALFVTGTLTAASATITFIGAPLASALLLVPAVTRALRASAPAGHGAPFSAASITGYGIRVWLGALSGIVLSRISQVLMVPLSNEFEAGIFAVAVTIGEVPLILSGGVRDVTFSADSSQPSSERLQKAARVTSAMTAAAALALGASSFVWVPLVFGREFAAAIPSALVVLVGTVLGSTGSVAGAGLSARGHPGRRSVAMTAAAVVNLTVLLIATPRLGALGAALAYAVGATVAGTLVVVLLSRLGQPALAFYGLRSGDLAVVGEVTGHLLRGARRRPKSGAGHGH